MKILSAETNLGSATNVSNAPVVRLFNSGDDNILVTRKDYQGANEGTFMVMSGDVVYCEKYYTDTLEGSADIKATKTAYSSMMKFVGSSVAGPTYTHAVSATNVDEGGSFTTTITTTNVDDGTNLYWELSGTNITSADFSSGALTGTASISSNSATFSHTVANDTFTEGTETVTIKVYSDSGRNTQVGNTLTVTLADTSLTPPYYSNEFSEGDGMQVSGNASHMSGFELDGNFTVECFFKLESDSFPATYRNIFNRWSGDEMQFQSHLRPDSTGGFKVQTWFGMNSNTTTEGNHIQLNTWHHYAFVRNGTNMYQYIDGVDRSGGGWSSNQNYNNNSNEEFRIGFRNDTNSYDFIGHISDVRYTVGQAIYTSNFTKPSATLTTTSQGATASNVKFLAMQSDVVTTVTKKPGGTTYETGEGQSAPSISTDNPF